MKGLKITLWVCAIGCLMGFPLALFPWKAIAAMCGWVGVDPPAAEPIVVYLVRIVMVLTGMIGVFFVILALNPLKYDPMLRLVGCGAILYGLVCLAGGMRYELPFQAFAWDMAFGIVAGVLVLIFRKKAIQASAA